MIAVTTLSIPMYLGEHPLMRQAVVSYLMHGNKSARASDGRLTRADHKQKD